MILSLIIGIVFITLKINNYKYIESNPNLQNNYSTIYLSLSIIFFIFFIVSLVLVVVKLKYTPNSNENIMTPDYKPIMSYDTNENTPNSPGTNKTPYGLSTSNLKRFPDLRI